MSELTYTSGVTGQVFDLESKLSWGAALGLRSREWDYSLTYRGLGMPTRKAREVSVSMSVINPSDLDAFMRATDADIQMNQPGVITTAGRVRRGMDAACGHRENQPPVASSCVGRQH